VGEKNFYLIRHGYDDHSYIDINNDPPLIEKGIVMAHQMADEMLDLLRSDETGRSISIRTSTKKRATETASILAEHLDTAKTAFDFTVDPNLRELQQGRIINFEHLTHQERVKLLEVAWKLFDTKRQAEDMSYRFGSPGVDELGELVLTDFMEPPYGESQNDFSQRLRVAFLDILNDMNENRLPIAVTHRGGIREISNANYAFNNNLPITQSRVMEMAGLKYCEIIDTNVSDIAFSIASLKNVLKTERGSGHELRTSDY
jgi:broad specificity phosphatase PhoE